MENTGTVCTHVEDCSVPQQQTHCFCFVFNVVVCRKPLPTPRCRSDLIDSAWVVIVPGQKCIEKKKEPRSRSTSRERSPLENGGREQP